MGFVTSIILQTFIAQAAVEQDSMDELADKLINKLSERLLGSHSLDGDLDDTTLAKTHPDMGLGHLTASSGSGCRPYLNLDAMQVGPRISMESVGMGSSPLAKLALTAIAATRDVSMAAQVKSEFDFDKKSKNAYETLKGVGSTDPTGFFDPFGLATDIGEDQLLFYRDAELKHGRIGMLAFVGMVSGEVLSPIFGGKPDVPSVFMWQCTASQFFWPTVISVVGITELFGIYEQDENDMFQPKPINPDLPGDYGFDPLGLLPKDAQARMEVQNKELNNGRLAMLAVAGIIAQEQVTGVKIFR